MGASGVVLETATTTTTIPLKLASVPINPGAHSMISKLCGGPHIDFCK